jgi:5'-methylthioadenosine phosphorylase
MARDVTVGVLGGTGLYGFEGLTSVEKVRLTTPFGDPSDEYVVGEYEGVGVAFLARHGRGHRLLPGEVNYRANIFGFKLLGVHTLLSVSAVGSMREEIHPMDVVLPDQFFDRTKARPATFFGDGLAAHISFADPVCPELLTLADEACRQIGLPLHRGGTYLCIEGPAFSTRAESAIYRSWGVDVIGMTALPEAKLAREAGICYLLMSFVSDYDVWHATEEAVNVEMILEVLRRNADSARRIVAQLLTILPEVKTCGCRDALKTAVITDRSTISPAVVDRLRPLIGEYLEPEA